MARRVTLIPSRRLPPARAPIANRWTPYGLERDPFFQTELGASHDALYPASAFFVGRAAELERVAITVGSGANSATVVEGDAGVGKTSFVNALKARLAAGGALTHEQPIRVLAEWRTECRPKLWQGSWGSRSSPCARGSAGPSLDTRARTGHPGT